MITSIPAFWLLKCDNISSIFYYNMTEFIRYPLTIYNKLIQVLLTFVLPYAFINFYPSQLFLGKKALFHPAFQYLTPIIGVVIFYCAYIFWKRGLNAYKGTGS